MTYSKYGACVFPDTYVCEGVVVVYTPYFIVAWRMCLVLPYSSETLL